jgi:hypothetical protein
MICPIENISLFQIFSRLNDLLKLQMTYPMTYLAENISLFFSALPMGCGRNVRISGKIIFSKTQTHKNHHFTSSQKEKTMSFQPFSVYPSAIFSFCYPSLEGESKRLVFYICFPVFFNALNKITM